MFIDAKKAHLNPKCEDDVYIDLPEEVGAGKGMCGKLVHWLYGFRPAAAAWEKFYAEKFESKGFKRGLTCGVVFYHPELDVSMAVHGDDFTFCGVQEELDWIKGLMESWFEVKIRGILGGDSGDIQQITLLGRIITWTPSGILYEADPRHIDLLSSSMGLTTANSISTPGVKDPEPNYSAIINDEDPAPPMSPCVDGGAVAAVMSEHGLKTCLRQKC